MDVVDSPSNQNEDMEMAVPMNFILRFLGYAALTMTTLFLIMTGLWDVFVHQAHWLRGLITAVVLLLFLRGMQTEWRVSVIHSEDTSPLTRSDLYGGAAVWIGAVVTYALHLEWGLSAVVASSLVGIVAHAMTRRLAVAAFCGSFVGMASVSVFPGYASLALAGLLAGVMYVASKVAFDGFGGKLGTIAFAGSIPVAFMFGSAFIEAAAPPESLFGHLVIAAIIAALFTYTLHAHLGFGPVLASGLVGLAAGIWLPLLDPVHGPLLAVMVFCASFVGMASRRRLPHAGAVALAGLFCALIFVFSTPYFAGAGGKLGTTAFASTAAVVGLWDLMAPRNRSSAVKDGQGAV